jgi:hypothetical protein
MPVMCHKNNFLMKLPIIEHILIVYIYVMIPIGTVPYRYGKKQDHTYCLM